MKRLRGDVGVWRFHGATGAAGQSLSWQYAASMSTPGEWGRETGEAGSLVPHETVGRG